MKKHTAVLSFILTAVLLSGCGNPKQDESSQPPSKDEAASWKTEGAVTSGKLEEGQELWPGKYLAWEHKSQSSGSHFGETRHLDSGACGELLWYLGMELGEDGNVVGGAKGEYVLEIYDTSDNTSTEKRFSPGELGLEGESGYILQMDMLDREHYAFRWADYEQDQEGMYRQILDRIIYTDFAGDIQTVDLWDFYLEKGILREEIEILPLWQHVNWRCDGEGNICVLSSKEDGGFAVYLLDKSASVLLEQEGTPGQYLADSVRTPDGELIFPIYSDGGKSYELFLADTSEKVFRSLGRMEAEKPYILQVYGMQGNVIYYRSQEGIEDGIVSWDIETGRKVMLLEFRTAGIDVGYQTLLALSEGGKPSLCLLKQKDGRTRQWVTALTEEKPEDDGVIQTADLVGNEKISECAVQASLDTPNFHFGYQEASEEADRDRILADLSQGNGPDLLFVSLEDFYMLEEKGLLLDMGDLISAQLQDEILPGALEIGTIDGRLLGIPAAVCAKTLAVSADVWPQETWRLEDVIDLMEKGKLQGGIRNLPHWMMGKYSTPDLAVGELVSYNLNDSFLIDWENRKSHFDDDRFIKLLELTRTDLSGTPVDTDNWLNGGKDILCGYFVTEANFLDFFVHMETEGGQIKGYPTEGACGSYLEADGGVLVVNANIAQKEAAVCFLETLLGKSLQSQNAMWGMSVRKLSLEDYLVEDGSGGFVFMGDSRNEVPVFQDGTTSLHRAKDFLESCTASPPAHLQIRKIIMEELNAMLTENKSAKSAADIINSRVQIYLDEMN